MKKKYLIFLVIIFSNCSSNKKNYSGEWININDYKTIINISEEGNNYILEIYNRKIVGKEQDGVLNFEIDGNNSNCVITEEGNILISNIGEFTPFKEPSTDEEKLNLLKNRILAAIKTHDYRSFSYLYVNEYEINDHYELSNLIQRPIKVWRDFKEREDGKSVNWEIVKLDTKSNENSYKVNPNYTNTVLTEKASIPIISGNEKFIMRQNVFIKVGDEFKICFLDGKVERFH